MNRGKLYLIGILVGLVGGSYTGVTLHIGWLAMIGLIIFLTCLIAMIIEEISKEDK